MSDRHLLVLVKPEFDLDPASLDDDVERLAAKLRKQLKTESLQVVRIDGSPVRAIDNWGVPGLNPAGYPMLRVGWAHRVEAQRLISSNRYSVRGALEEGDEGFTQLYPQYP